jgi:hypothetical protein
MSIFISYARKDRAAVDTLRHDLERARSAVWLDDELTGGQAWWETILGEIRSCELFVFALSPDSLRSKACQAELRYAVELKRPLLAVMVRAVSVQLAPAAIADTQIIDYTERTADSAVALVTAAANRPLAPPLPQPLPTPPPPPMSYMNPYREQIQSSDLSFREQAQVVLALRGHVQDEDERDTARELLVELRHRQDIAESVAREIDELLASIPVAEATSTTSAAGSAATWTTPTSPTSTSTKPTEPTPTPSSARVAAAWHPDPTGRFEQRYWDGSRWTEHVSSAGRPTVDALEPNAAHDATRAASMPTANRSTGGSPGTGPIGGGAYVLLIIATVFFGIIGVIAGAINLRHPSRRSQAQVLLWLGIISMVVGFLILSTGSQ